MTSTYGIRSTIARIVVNLLVVVQSVFVTKWIFPNELKSLNFNRHMFFYLLILIIVILYSLLRSNISLNILAHITIHVILLTKISRNFTGTLIMVGYRIIIKSRQYINGINHRRLHVSQFGFLFKNSKMTKYCIRICTHRDH